MIELKIDPKFRDLIPKLSDAEYEQLEKNILAEGKIREPIVVWDGTIIDGHHRYYIARKHPDIPVEVEEKEFANDHEALAWACDNQLGRRNLSPFDERYLLGKERSETKLAGGGTGSNQYTVLQPHQNDEAAKNERGTSGRIAEKHHVGSATVERAEQFYHGIESAEEYDPYIKDKMRSGEIKVPNYVVAKLPKAKPDVREAAVKAIDENRPEKANSILDRGSVEEPVAEVEPYNAEDMAGEIDAASKTMLDTLEQILFKSHLDIVHNSDGNAMARVSLVEHLTGINGIIDRLKKEMED